MRLAKNLHKICPMLGNDCKLQMKKIHPSSYKFLVRAVNKDGDSPDLTTDDFTAIKLPYEVPTPVIRQQERRKIPCFLN